MRRSSPARRKPPDPIKLATDAEPRPGFIIYVPVYADIFGDARRSEALGRPSGFAFGGFRTGQFVDAALNSFPYLPVAMTVADADAPQTVLYTFGEQRAKAPRAPATREPRA